MKRFLRGMAYRLRSVLWFLYAIVFLLLAYDAVRDDLSLRYPIYYVIPGAVSYVVVTAGVFAYGLRFRPSWLVRLARPLFPVLVAFPLIGIVMDCFLPADASRSVVLITSAIAVILITPGYIAIWRLGGHDT